MVATAAAADVAVLRARALVRQQRVALALAAADVATMVVVLPGARVAANAAQAMA